MLRLIISQLAVLGGDLSLKERIFVSLAWLPKATVQAAIGPLALDKAKNLLSSSFPDQSCDNLMMMDNSTNNTMTDLDTACSMLEYGNIVLTVAVSVIIITAPIGAVAIMVSGPRLLTSNVSSSQEDALKSDPE